MQLPCQWCGRPSAYPACFSPLLSQLGGQERTADFQRNYSLLSRHSPPLQDNLKEGIWANQKGRTHRYPSWSRNSFNLNKDRQYQNCRTACYVVLRVLPRTKNPNLSLCSTPSQGAWKTALVSFSSPQSEQILVRWAWGFVMNCPGLRKPTLLWCQAWTFKLLSLKDCFYFILSYSNNSEH